jgi:hypothetical protein
VIRGLMESGQRRVEAVRLPCAGVVRTVTTESNPTHGELLIDNCQFEIRSSSLQSQRVQSAM